MTEPTPFLEWYMEIPPPCTNGHVWLWTSGGTNRPKFPVGLSCRCGRELWKEGPVQEP